ncbi:hypothetical protein [Patulibacter americanus]|uniref:hypothetical protein n=1 Tax=Patulibacter americanus TaxID=588672 RepID=UPI0003FB9347|nr:hypothetical protein [Patulibacter americanus]
MLRVRRLPVWLFLGYVVALAAVFFPFRVDRRGWCGGTLGGCGPLPTYDFLAATAPFVLGLGLVALFSLRRPGEGVSWLSIHVLTAAAVAFVLFLTGSVAAAIEQIGDDGMLVIK